MDGLFRVGLPLEDIIRCLFFGVLIWFLGIIRVFSFLGMRCLENLSFFFVVFGNCFIYYLAGRGKSRIYTSLWHFINNVENFHHHFYGDYATGKISWPMMKRLRMSQFFKTDIVAMLTSILVNLN